MMTKEIIDEEIAELMADNSIAELMSSQVVDAIQDNEGNFGFIFNDRSILKVTVEEGSVQVIALRVIDEETAQKAINAGLPVFGPKSQSH